jgi:hypothetical protein
VDRNSLYAFVVKPSGTIIEGSLLFLNPWKPLSASGTRFFEEELLKELGPLHPLYGRRFCPGRDVREQMDTLTFD